MRYVKPALIDLGVLDDVVVIGPDDRDRPDHEADHEVNDDYNGEAPAEPPTGAD